MPRLTSTRTRAAVAALVVGILATAQHVHGQDLEIGIIDFYGLRQVSAVRVREALTFKEGDRISMASGERPSFLQTAEDRLAKLPGVARARIEKVCCDDGRAILYVGIEERGAPTIRFRAAPTGTARLAADIVQAGEELSRAIELATQRGDAAEDHAQGHALAHDPATRAIQDRFVVYAARDLPALGRVLRSSSNAAQRALAALVLGYAPDKQAVVGDLVDAMSDPADAVRNNALRALWVFAEAAPSASGSRLRIPIEPFIRFLNSPVWSDRNKASLAVMALSASRDPGQLARLRREALTPLVEIARWKSAGHALGAFITLGRIAGFSDEAAGALWKRGDREAVIGAALKAR